MDAVLEDLRILAMQHEGEERAHPIEVLRTMAVGHGGVDRSLQALEERGLARRTESGDWSITDRGMEQARRQSGPREGAE